MNKENQLKFINENYELYCTHSSKRKIRHDIFSNIETELQAYLLGIYASDGSADMKRKTIRLQLQSEDKDIVNLFKNTISPNARTFVKQPYKTTGRNGMIINGNGSYGVDISSSIIVNDLIKIGFPYNKSYYNIKIPNINKDLVRHFIRGYFDGDGCITGWLSIEKGKKDRVRYSFDICSKQKAILYDIIDFFNENDININLNYIKRDDMYRIKTSSKLEIKKIYNLLYNDSNFYLNRKYNKFNYYVNTEISQLIADHCNA